MVDKGQHSCFNELCLADGRLDTYQRLIGEDDRAFGHGIDFPGKAQLPEKVQKCFAEQVQGTQIGDILFIKVKVVDIVDNAFHSAHDRITGLLPGPEKNIEYRFILIHALGEIAVHHGELIEVRHHGKISFLVIHWISLPPGQ